MRDPRGGGRPPPRVSRHGSGRGLLSGGPDGPLPGVALRLAGRAAPGETPVGSISCREEWGARMTQGRAALVLGRSRFSAQCDLGRERGFCDILVGVRFPPSCVGREF